MKQDKEAKISYWAAHLTTIVSVTLVLLIVGLIALTYIGTATESRRLKERLELSAVMADTVSDASARRLYDVIKQQSYTASAKFISRQQALDNWKQDTGEDLEELFGANPLSPEVSFTVKSTFANDSSLARIRQSLESVPGVAAVAAPDAALVEGMNRNINRLTWILGSIALIMIVISFVLINNTVHLAIYARRFTIHTMQLVGATNGFIRRPFIWNNVLSGFIATLIATGLLAGAIAGAAGAGYADLSAYVSWPVFFIVAAGLLVAATLICALSAAAATSKYLHRDYDQLFH